MKSKEGERLLAGGPKGLKAKSGKDKKVLLREGLPEKSGHLASV